METIRDLWSDPLIQCPACGNREWKKAGQVKDYSITGEWFELRECPVCHLKITHPQPTAETLGRYYASKDYISHSDTRSGMINRLFHRAREIMLKKKYQWVTGTSGKQNGVLADIGAGTGHFAKYMQDHGWQVTGLEPDETARKVALEKLDLKLLPLENLASLHPHSFDVITLWHVLEHVQDLDGYLEHFRTILLPEGVLIIAVPNHTSVDARHYKLQWAAYDVPRHLWHFSPASMEKLLDKHGFRITGKKAMPLDGFYVSMLSEKYRENQVLGTITAFINGWRSYRAGKKAVDKASSIIYIARLKT